MSLSRKRRRELKKLRKLTNSLVGQQREVIDHAGSVLHEAGSQARKIGNEHLVPRIEDAYNRAAPTVEAGFDVARGFGRSLRNATAPVAAGALARAVAALETSDNKDAARRLRRYGERQGLLKKKRGVGGIIGAILGTVAAVAVGYSLWQAFRDDDELWVAPPEQDA
ncbi:MAG: DNA/RNA helicase [Canibacter sp.]